MGCDIHLFVEQRERIGAPWKPVRVETPCSGWRHEKGERYSCKGTGRESGYDGRNYDVFAVLAGVRNADDHLPIAAPRGLPDDMSAELRAVLKSEGGDAGAEDWEERYEKNEALYGNGSFGDHSFSHVSLAELLAYDWDRRVTISGVVNPAQYAQLATTGKPKSYCGGVSGPMIRFVSLRTMRAIADGGTFADESSADSYDGPKLLELSERAKEVVGRDGFYWRTAPVFSNGPPTGEGFVNALGAPAMLYANVEWQDTARERCGDFCERFVPALMAAATTGNDNLRLVFGFDS